MRTPAEVANAAVARVGEKMATGSDIGGNLWRTSIAEEVTVHQREIGKAVVDTINKFKPLKAKDRKALAAELEAALSGGR